MNPNTTRAFAGFRRSGVRFGATTDAKTCGTISVRGDTPSDDTGGDQPSASIPPTYIYGGAGLLGLLLLISR